MVLRLPSIARFLLFSVTLISSFQFIGRLVGFYNYLDEIFIILLTFISILAWKRIKVSRLKLRLIAILLTIVFLSTLINFYAIQPIFIKLVYYIKCSFVFFLIPFLSREFADEKLRKQLFFLVIGISVIAIIEFSVIQFLFFSGETQYRIFGVFLKSREGIYRATSVTGHPINLGMVGLMGMMYLFEQFNKKRVLLLLLFMATIVASGSRIPMLLAIIYLAIKVMDQKLVSGFPLRLKHIYILTLPVVAVFFISALPKYFKKSNEMAATRSVSIVLGTDLFNDPVYTLLGTGIGSYGMYESVEYHSKVYDLLDYPIHYQEILKGHNRSSGMESYFFMMVFEIGIIATLFFFVILVPFQSKFNILNSFFVLVLISVALAYPIYTLPFIYLFTIWFPNYSDK